MVGFVSLSALDTGDSVHSQSSFFLSFFFLSFFFFLFFFFFFSFFFFFFFKILFILTEGKGRRKRGRETSVCGCLSSTPYRGPGLQPRHMPWLGMEPANLWFTGWHSIHWVPPARAMVSLLSIACLNLNKSVALAGQLNLFQYHPDMTLLQVQSSVRSHTRSNQWMHK